jgi:hypothetical protein
VNVPKFAPGGGGAALGFAFGGGLAMSIPTGRGGTMDERQIAKRIEILKIEHRDLDAAISALFEQNSTDQLQLARLKKRKLRLRDEMAFLEDQLIPDIIA